MGAYVLPMPEGHHMKKILYRQLRKKRVSVINRFMATSLFKGKDGAIAGAFVVNPRTAETAVIKAKTVILCTGAAGRLGMPTSGYLFGTYENPTNAGDGYSMAYNVGAELSGLECYQINPLIKDYNGPACAYVTGPMGGYTANSKGNRFIECDYWSGQMMLEFYKELEGGNGPVFLKIDHLAEETIEEIEVILHSNERPSRGRFHENRGTNYRERMVEMHISEIGFCSGHSASGIWTDENARTTIPGLYAAGDCGSVPHNYMLGAFVYGAIAAEDAVQYCTENEQQEIDSDEITTEKQRVLAPMQVKDGIPAEQMEYKIRRLVNDYLQPPKVTRKMEIGMERFAEIRAELPMLQANDPHELMRAMEVHFILDCAEMAATASMYRTESRWGLYHYYVDHPDTDNEKWNCHVQTLKGEDGRPTCTTRPIEPFIVELDEEEMGAYNKLRVSDEDANAKEGV